VWFDEAIAWQDATLDGQPCQPKQLKPDPPAGPTLRQEIVWNAFPGNQLRRWGRPYALIAADHLLALDQHYLAPHSGGSGKNDPTYKGDQYNSL
jgi:hypothetical protein